MNVPFKKSGGGRRSARITAPRPVCGGPSFQFSHLPVAPANERDFESQTRGLPRPGRPPGQYPRPVLRRVKTGRPEGPPRL
jgi:hypothetical protein